jgi:hypothetical protein
VPPHGRKRTRASIIVLATLKGEVLFTASPFIDWKPAWSLVLAVELYVPAGT